ncbi:MAG: hypothetical protein ACI4D8_07235 [Wujia sp.]
MKCSKCNFENVPGAAFCGNCGSPMPAEKPVSASNMEPMTTPITPASNNNPVLNEMPKNETADKTASKAEAPKNVIMDVVQTGGPSEENTTVLTNNMAPMSAMANKQNQGAPVPPSFGGPTPTGAPSPQKPAAPAGMGVAPGQMKPVPNQGAPKQNPPKQNNTNKPAKKSKGSLVYIIISVILMVGMAAAIVVGYLHFTGEVDDANKKNDELASAADASAADYELALQEKDDEIANLESQIETLKTDMDNLEVSVSEYQSQIEDMSAANDQYAAYDALIEYASQCEGQDNGEFICSSNILHLSANTPETYIYVYSPATQVTAEVADTGIANVELVEEASENGVYTFKVTAADMGNTVVYFINENEDEITTFIYVD